MDCVGQVRSVTANADGRLRFTQFDSSGRARVNLYPSCFGGVRRQFKNSFYSGTYRVTASNDAQRTLLPENWHRAKTTSRPRAQVRRGVFGDYSF